MNCLWARLPGNGLSLTANRHIGPLPGGGSGGQLYEVAENSSAYAVKLKGNAQTTRVLFNEYVCGRIGELLGVPFGEHALIQVTAALLPGGAGGQLEGGNQCGTVYFPNAQTDLSQLRQASNGSTFAAVLVFDTFIALRDGRQTCVYPCDGNPNGARDVGAIFDQGHALRGSPAWTEQDLQADNTCVVVDANLGLKQWFPNLPQYEPYLGCLEVLTRNHFQNLVNEAPLAEWGVTPQEAISVIDWLNRRKTLVRGAIAAYLV